MQILSNGYVMGKIKKLKLNTTVVSNIDIDVEMAKYEAGYNKTLDQLNKLKEDKPNQAEYLAILELMVKDPYFKDNIINYIKNKNTACASIKLAMNEFMLGLKNSKSTYLNERVNDLEDVSLRLIYNIEDNEIESLNEKYILYADNIYPSYLISHMDNILGIIAKNGGYTSHAAILCRNNEIPFVVSDIEADDNVLAIIDTRKNKIIIDPCEDEVDNYINEINNNSLFEKKAIPHDDYLFLANVGNNNDLAKVIDYGFDGVGLYRTEMIFMNTDKPMPIFEQYQIYKEAIDICRDKFICFRTFDIGDDKQLSYLKSFKKGIDNYKNNPGIFEAQVEAILMANTYNNVRIMFPMIETLEEFKYLKDWVLKIATKRGYNIPKIGMMLETKEAIMHINSFKDADFISVGTNDLTHELYHVNRDSNDKMEYINDLLNNLKPVVKLCNDNNICLSVCGELAGITNAALGFYSIGIKNLSVSPTNIRSLNSAYKSYIENKEV